MSVELNARSLLSAASRRWGIHLSHRRLDLALAGSPERSAWRSVVAADDGRLYVLEKIPSPVYQRKRRIAASLQRLVAHGLRQVVAYLPDIDGEAIVLIHEGTWHGLWQLSPFVAGVDLNRTTYGLDGWRGEAAAQFLMDLNRMPTDHHAETDGTPFSIVAYCRNLFARLVDRHPTIAATFRPFMNHLEAHSFPVHDRLPMDFCHGDYHPLNIIWGEKSIRAVIDWEFCGIKPEIYDLANLLGCLGMEDPRNLTGPFAERLIHCLRKAGIFSDASWQALPDLILAIRFAWLSEWLRKDDRPMIGLEADYMALLLSRQTPLRHFFGLSN